MTKRAGQVESGHCKACKAPVYITHHGPGKGFTSHHQYPICDAWARLMAELKPKSIDFTVLPDGYNTQDNQ